MKQLDILAITAVILAVGLQGAALAQAYKWRDDKGQIVYSDQPPPKNIPPGNIIQGPKAASAAKGPATPIPVAATPAVATAGAAASAQSTKGAPKPAAGPKSVAEQEADYKKRQIEAQKKAKEDADKATQEQQRQASCTGLRQNLAGLEGGQRISRIDEKGERSFIDDAQRAADIAKAKQDLTAARC